MAAGSDEVTVQVWWHHLALIGRSGDKHNMTMLLQPYGLQGDQVRGELPSARDAEAHSTVVVFRPSK